jgi:hypothetical protein
MIRDRDSTYGGMVTHRLRAMGIRDKLIAPASPWPNGFAERLIGSISRECLDHIVVFGEAHLLRILRSYARYYNDVRTHRSLERCSGLSPGSAVRQHHLVSHPWADSITAMPGSGFSVHTVGQKAEARGCVASLPRGLNVALTAGFRSRSSGR